MQGSQEKTRWNVWRSFQIYSDNPSSSVTMPINQNQPFGHVLSQLDHFQYFSLVFWKNLTHKHLEKKEVLVGFSASSDIPERCSLHHLRTKNVLIQDTGVCGCSLPFLPLEVSLALEVKILPSSLQWIYKFLFKIGEKKMFRIIPVGQNMGGLIFSYFYFWSFIQKEHLLLWKDKDNVLEIGILVYYHWDCNTCSCYGK